MNAGMGLVYGYGPGIYPGTWVVSGTVAPDDPSQSLSCLTLNDGFFVGAEKARAMAHQARLIVDYQRRLMQQWEGLTDEQRCDIEKNGMSRSIYNRPVRSDFVDRAEAFADWAGKSRGFYIW